MKKTASLIALLLAAVLLSACTGTASPAENPVSGEETGDGTNDRVASAADMAPVENVVEEGMTPVYGSDLRDGIYAVDVDSSSSMFHITRCELMVNNGQMTALMHMGGTGYLYVFMGTAQEAAQSGGENCIPFTEAADGTHAFLVPVDALDMGISCAAFSKNKELWYDRTLVFRADSLPLDAFRDGVFNTVESLGLADGSYTVSVALEGGSGKASVESPAALRVEQGEAWVTIVWGSSNYDYMKVGEEMFLPLDREGNSAFEIPAAAFDCPVPVLADTTAMSTPHEISYTLFFASDSIESVP